MAPTQRVKHGVEACPECGTNLGGGWVQRTWEVIEVPVVPEDILVARLCPVWEQRWVPRVGLQGVVVGQQGLGVNPSTGSGHRLVSLMVTVREEGRLPLRTIQW